MKRKTEDPEIVMNCRICKKKEKGADVEAFYICSTCTYKIGSISYSNARAIVDELYLADRGEDALFVEKIISGTNNNNSQIPQLKKRTVPINLRKRR